MIAYLVAEGAKINVRNRDGVTPLIAVAGTSRLDTVSFLVDNGAEVNAHGEMASFTLYKLRNRYVHPQIALAELPLTWLRFGDTWAR